MNATRSDLKQTFPWLGTDESVNGADVIDQLNEIYRNAPLDEPAVGLKADGLKPSELSSIYAWLRRGPLTRRTIHHDNR
jgi:hypothetical protein